MTVFHVMRYGQLSITSANPYSGLKQAFLRAFASYFAWFSLGLRENDAWDPAKVLAVDAGEGAESGGLRNRDGVGGDSVETSRLPEPS